MRRFLFTILATLFITGSGCQMMERIKDNAAADYSHVTTGSESDYIRSGGNSHF